MTELDTITVTYKSTRNAFIASQYLDEIRQHPIFSWDLEVAVRYTPEETAHFMARLEEDNVPKMERIQLQSKLDASALGHPSHCQVTHCSMSVNDHEAYVFILDNTSISKLIFQFLVTTTQKQIIHNASYDFRHIHYHTGQFPIDYEDTQILAKTLVNHVETYKANTGLKDLMSHAYGGKWSLSSDAFDISNMYEPWFLHYCAIDSASVYKLYHDLRQYAKDNS